MKKRFYKDSKIEPMLGDVVLQHGQEMVVKCINIGYSGQFVDCSFDGSLSLNNPEKFEFVGRGEK